MSKLAELSDQLAKELARIDAILARFGFDAQPTINPAAQHAGSRGFNRDGQ